MTKRECVKKLLAIDIQSLPFNYPKDGKIEIVKNGQFKNINIYCFSREKENKDE